jgi:hypothetical protein
VYGAATAATGRRFSGTTVNHSFDSAGFRRQRVRTGSATRYLLSGLFETDGAGMITLTDVDGAAGDLAHYAGPPAVPVTVSYLCYNGHGDLAGQADSRGTCTAAGGTSRPGRSRCRRRRT